MYAFAITGSTQILYDYTLYIWNINNLYFLRKNKKKKC